MEKIIVDLIPGGIMPICHASQYDKERTIRVYVTENGQLYTFSNETCVLHVRKPDTTVVTVPLTVTASTNYVDISTDEQMVAVNGRNVCELRVSNGTKEIGSGNFYMDVEHDPLDSGSSSASEIHDLPAQVAAAVDEYMGDDYGLDNLADINLDNPTDGQVLKYDAESGKWINDTDASGITHITELEDVDITTPTDGQVLKWDDANSKWVNDDDSVVSNLSDLGDVTLSSPTDGQVLKWNATDNKWVNADDSTVSNLSDLSDVTLSSLADGQMIMWDATANKWKNINIPSEIDDSTKSASKTWSSNKIYNELDNKADTDGTYDLMTVGNAKQLKSNVGEVDKVPYLFRTSGGSIDIGDRETDMLVGGTVAFNQLVQNGNFATTDNWTTFHSTKSVENNELTITVSSGESSGTCYQDIAVISGHKYFISAFAKCGTAESVRITYNGAITGYTEVTSNSYQSTTKIAQASTTSLRVALTVYGDGLTGMAKNVNVFDLTAMFGTTIADYIYSLEQSVAGSGVAWFRNLFPKSYYAYNSGSLMSVKTSKHITTGFNQWDEEVEKGYINTNTGLDGNTNNELRSKSGIYYPIVPNTNYYFKQPVNGVMILFYDYDKSYIGQKITSNGVFTSPSKAYYFRLTLGNTYGTTYNNDICINLSWDGERDGEYEPYVKHEYDYSGEREVTRYFGIVTYDGSSDENWSVSTSGKCQISLLNGQPDDMRVVANNKLGVPYNDRSFADKTICWVYATQNILIVMDDVTTKEDWLTKLSNNPLTIIYVLATPYTETVSNPELRGIPKLDANNKLYYYGDTCSDLPNPQAVDDFGTEEYVDNREVAIPVGHDTFYQANLRAKLEMSPDSPSGDGDYIVRQTNGQNEYVAFVKELPTLPSTDGTYTLKVTVSGSTKTLSWVADT